MLKNLIKKENFSIPTHIAIIMDGNARWAKKKFLPNNLGYKKGIDIAENIISFSKEIGVKYLTLFAFSSENWSRAKQEVKELMDIKKKHTKDNKAKC